MSLSKVIELARGELGNTEEPAGSNLTKYGFWYGVNGVPWCVIFLCWLFNQAGERMAFFGGGKTASCSVLLRWYREQGLTVPVSEVQPGDIVLLNFNGKSTPDHCGLVTKVSGRRIDVGTLEITTIEGNTSSSNGSQSNGGMVCEKQRYPRQIVGVCRPQYQPEEPQIIPDYMGRWSQKYWEKSIELGIIDKAKDGKYRPKDNATREEVLAMIIRSREVKE